MRKLDKKQLKEALFWHKVHEKQYGCPYCRARGWFGKKGHGVGCPITYLQAVLGRQKRAAHAKP